MREDVAVHVVALVVREVAGERREGEVARLAVVAREAALAEDVVADSSRQEVAHVEASVVHHEVLLEGEVDSVVAGSETCVVTTTMMILANGRYGVQWIRGRSPGNGSVYCVVHDNKLCYTNWTWLVYVNAPPRAIIRNLLSSKAQPSQLIFDYTFPVPFADEMRRRWLQKDKPPQKSKHLATAIPNLLEGPDQSN